MSKQTKKNMIEIAKLAFKAGMLVTVKFANGKEVKCYIREIDKGSFLAEYPGEVDKFKGFHAEWRNVFSIE